MTVQPYEIDLTRTARPHGAHTFNPAYVCFPGTRGNQRSPVDSQYRTTMSDHTFASADYELLWPRELFIRELTSLSPLCQDNHPNEWIELLLEEAFLGDTPVQDYKSFSGSWGRVHITELIAHTPQLREHHAPAPYWSARHGAATGGYRRGPNQLRSDFTQFISSLHVHGYLNQALSKLRIDDSDGAESDLEVLLADRLGVLGLWPLRPADWDENTFYDLVEIFHDLVARPRTRHGHRKYSYSRRYSDFAADTGRALYRWKVNKLLESAAVELRLASDGEDVGRLVHVADDARTDLIERALATSAPNVASRVEHAIALFRRRGATEHDKRSAAITLAGILEERRALIRAEVGKKDEGALFNLANEFAIRHQRRNQRGDYDPAFLDWIVWWYLATIELTNRILARQ